ncbi:MAG: sulfurtransferase TusA family protein [Planctomycetota bacterium]|jgi:TusA-related sulfurtransferase
MSEEVDARGLSCPQPVILTRAALQKSSGGQVIVLVDTMTQVHNCTRAAEKLGWKASYDEKEGAFELTLRK